jgi:hypothetical protein
MKKSKVDFRLSTFDFQGGLMRRVAAFALIVSLSNVSMAVAGEPLLSVATRVTQESTKKEGAPAKSVTRTTAQKSWAMAQEQPAMSSSGLRRRTKLLIFVGAALGASAAWYTIDHKVEDNTPSTLGTRQD